MKAGRRRLLFIIRSLETGGAEQQLLTLVRGLDPGQFEITVASMYSGGAMRPRFEAVPELKLVSLNKGGRWDLGRFGMNCLRLLRATRPDLIHGYMTGANELATALAVLARCKSVWGIRVSDQDWSRYSAFRRMVFKLGCGLSRLPDLIIANSAAGRDWHVQAGYHARRFVVVPNGIDVDRFRPDEAAGQAWRARNGIGTSDRLILMPARLDPMKDHDCFLEAAARLKRLWRGPQSLRFLCLGNRIGAYGDDVLERVSRMGLGDCVEFRPAEADMVGAYNGADIVVSTSAFGEGFPNVIGEAMACGRLVCATDCGDAAQVIGNPELIVKPRSPGDLAHVWQRLLCAPQDEQASLRLAHRTRVFTQFAPDKLVQRTTAALLSVTERC